jgi:hypothetical protein
MKKLATLLTLMAGVGLTLGQGVIHNPGIVSFVNTEATKAGLPAGITNHLVYAPDGTAVVGTNYKAELYQVNPDNSLTAIPSSISLFKLATTSQPGTWSGPSSAVNVPTGGGVDVYDNGTGETFPDTGTGRYPVTFVVQAWDSGPAGSLTYAQATVKGQSLPFVYTQTFTPNTADIQMKTQPGFSLVPEPSAIALSVMGVAGLLLIRRRK